MAKQKISIFWFRRDLRLKDNHGLSEALKGPNPVLPLFIFDREITDELPKNDPRLQFIHTQLRSISNQLNQFSSSLYCKQGSPLNVWKEILDIFEVQAVYVNEDYEPYAAKRDQAISRLLDKHGIPLLLHKDQVIFSPEEILKKDDSPYTVYTPYKNKWLEKWKATEIAEHPINTDNFAQLTFPFPELSTLLFEASQIKVKDFQLSQLDNYEQSRNFPGLEQTSNLGPHLRFGTVSVRDILTRTKSHPTFVNELVWREFFMQILFHFPKVVEQNFRSKYDLIRWRNDPNEFETWTKGETGYPMVDAGMRELNQTGYMHNRVRMVAASFLCKHLLIDWRWGEAYFASKLLDYELSANNGNWQWSAGTGCDAAPYFRIFNPIEQLKKFDPQLVYVKKWIPDFETSNYPTPMVDHKYARTRALATYKDGIARFVEQ
jgi:deoxyribodipyrimidine photo-lyase